MTKRSKKPLEVAIVIGTHPAVMLASCLPAPFGMSEYHVANSLLGKRLVLTKCEKVNILAPAEAEIVLEGRINSKEAPEGPFADLLGTYDIVRRQPIVEVTEIMRRENCIYQAILPVGLEASLLMGIGRELSIWNTLKGADISVRAVNLTPGSCNWLHGVISIKKQKESDVKKAIDGAFSAHPSLKLIIIVDEDIDVFDPKEVEWAIATRFQASKGMTVLENVHGSTIDPSSENGITTKVGIDATIPLGKPSWIFRKARIPESSHVRIILKKLLKEKATSDCF